jgi:hypothetical protein
MPRSPGPATPKWNRFVQGIAKAIVVLGGDRAAEHRSGVNKSVWYDAKTGRAIPAVESTWPAMREVLATVPQSSTGIRDWDELYLAVRWETGRPARNGRAESRKSLAGPSPPEQNGPPVSPDGGRLHLAGRSTMTAFALPTVSRLDLLSRFLDRAGAIPGQVLFLVGEGGLGKSVLLGQLADKLASTSQADTERQAPAVVLVACNRIPPSADLSTEEAADVAFARAADLASPEGGLRRLVRELRDLYGSVYLLIDTLDVIMTDDTVPAITTLLAEVADAAQLFLTCRAREFEDLLQDPQSHQPRLAHRTGDAVQMPKLRVEEILSWAASYVQTLDRSGEERERFISSLSDAVSAATVREICAVPLRLALACDLYSDTGTVPADLTITGLYQSYWDMRIARDRYGRRTAQGEAQEAGALALAKAILSQSGDRLSTTVGAAQLPSDAGMRALVSEGAVRRQAGRYEFFHQSYAEFAIARLLAEAGDEVELTRLRSMLQDPHSFLWPVARHLLLQRSVDDRYRDLQAAVPQRTPEGARIHLLAAQMRESPALLVALAQTIRAHDPLLLQSVMPLLADTPPSCADVALEISVPMLADIGRNRITEAARTVGMVLPRASGSRRVHYLSWALDLVARRKEELPEENWLNLPEKLIKPICSTGMGPGLHQLLHRRYPELGVCAQRAILRAALTTPWKGTSDTGAARSAWTTLANSMLSVECPPEMLDQELVEVLRRCWANEEVRRDRGWSDWREVLQADLPLRWESAQVRLANEFARDPDVRRDLMEAVLSDAPLLFRDRWVNTAKFVANDALEEVLTYLLGLPTRLGREAVGSAASLSNHIAGRLGRTDRQRLIATLAQFEQVDPRRIWPALIVLAGPDVDLHQQLLALFAEIGPSGQDSAETVASAKLWEVVRASGLDTWLNMAPTDFLLRSRDEFRALLPATGGKATQRRAKFEGRIALYEIQARDWLRDQVLDGASSVTARVGIGTVKGAAAAAQVSLTPSLVAWMLRLIPTRHTEAARQIASILFDKELTPDSAIVGIAAESPATDLEEPTGMGDLISIARTAAVARLESAVGSGEDTQLTLALIDLLLRLDELRPLPVEDVQRVLDKMTQPVLAIAERIKAGVTKQSKAEMASDLSRWAATVGTLGLRRLPTHEVERTVRQVLAGWDSHDLGNRITRVVARVFKGVLNHSPSFADWLIDELWPVTGYGTKLAVAEAIAVHERITPGHHALTLARRSDCPPEIAARIHKWLQD